MKKAFSLIEVVALLVVLVALGTVFSLLFSTALMEIPLAVKTVDSAMTVSMLVDNMQTDVGKSSAASQQKTLDPNTRILLLKNSDSVVRYIFTPDQISRQIPDANEKTKFAIERTWQPPNSAIDWRITNINGSSCVEITTGINYAYRGKEQKRLQNSHIFFVGANTIVGETK